MPTQLTANSFFQVLVLLLYFLALYSSCENAGSILLGTKSHLAPSLALHTNPPACAACLPGYPTLIRAPCSFVIPHSALRALRPWNGGRVFEILPQVQLIFCQAKEL